MLSCHVAWGTKRGEVTASRPVRTGGGVSGVHAFLWENPSMMDVIAILVVFLALKTVVIVSLLIRQKRRMRAEQALRREKEELDAMVDRVPVIIWAARPDTTLKYLNQRCVEFTGLPKEVLQDNGWLSAVHPEDLERCIGTYIPAIEARQPFKMEYRARRVDGAYQGCWMTAFPASGRMEPILGISAAPPTSPPTRMPKT